MEIVPRIRAFDDHHEKIATVVEVAVADGGLKQVAVRFDPVVDVDRWKDLGRRAGADGLRW